jgi:hypothetical protein
MAHRPIVTGPVVLVALCAHALWAMITHLCELIVRSLPDYDQSGCLATSHGHEPWAMIAHLRKLIAPSLPNYCQTSSLAHTSRAIIGMSRAQ